MTLRQLCHRAQSRLEPLYGDGEARWLVRVAMEYLKGYTLADLALKGDAEVTGWLQGKMDEVVGRLLNHEPIQYIFGYTRFYGLKIKVSPDTLIPRPETEELVGLIVDDFGHTPDLKVLDACTGSGCIALALARNLPFAHVSAFDLSESALKIAEENDAMLRTKVHIYQADALRLPPASTPLYDIVVSNPPYVTGHERAAMDFNVLDFEPPQALFVPDDDPLRFYHVIARYALTALHPGGKIYFEINPLFADELRDDMSRQGWGDVTLIADSSARMRFLTAICPGL